MCNCKNIEIGSYKNQIELPRPDHMKGREEGTRSNTICIDACLKSEILFLWSEGISTTGCCCGHNKIEGYVGVIPEHIQKMKSIGYQVQHNPNRPKDQDTFNLKLLY